MKYNAKFTKIEDGYYRAKINNVELWEVDELLVWTIKEREKEIERLNNIINELEKALKNNIDMCDGFIDTATSDLQELGARHNGKAYYQTILLENKIALKIYQKELNKLQELKGSDKE